MLTKYPPIEGGVASSAYWLARALGGRGHEVHVVTNALQVEEFYREQMEPEDPEWTPPGVQVHSTSPGDEANPMHIPYSFAFCERLAGLALTVVQDRSIEVLDCWYLMPYAVAGYLVASLTGIPLIIRHAGSDVGRLARVPHLRELFRQILAAADLVISNPYAHATLHALGVSLESTRYLPEAVPDPDAFHPDAAPLDLPPSADLPGKAPIFMHLGKTPYRWQSKGLYELVMALALIREPFKLVLVADGPRLDEVTEVGRSTLGERFCRLPFLPPWRLPALLRRANCVVLPERGFEVPNHFSLLASEALCAGVCTILGQELHRHPAHSFLQPGRDVLTVDPHDLSAFSSTLLEVLRLPEAAHSVALAGRQAILKHMDYHGYVEANLKVYREAMGRFRGRVHKTANPV